MAIPAGSQTLSQRWMMTLTQGQRDDWQTLLEAGPYPDTLAVPTALTARRLYMRVNLLRKIRGLAPIDDAPADQTVTELVSATPTAAHTPTLSIALATSPLDAGSRMLIMATKGFPAADPPNDRALKRIGLTGDGQATPYNALSQYAAIWGNPIEGQSIRFVMAPLVDATGAIGTAIDHTIVVT